MKAAPPVLDAFLSAQGDVLRKDTALMVIDAQDRYCGTAKNNADVSNALAGIDAARRYFDAQCMPCFLVCHTDSRAPSAYAKGPDRLHAQRFSGNYEIIYKEFSSAFVDALEVPPLPGILAKLMGLPASRQDPLFAAPMQDALWKEYKQVRHLVMTGFNTSACVYLTALDALSRNYKVTILRDATANCIVFREDPDNGALALERLQKLGSLQKKGATVTTLAAFQKSHAQRTVLETGLSMIKPGMPF